MQIVSKSSQNHSNLYDSEWRISFLSDMRCVIRPQNYSIRKPMNFAIFLKRYFQRTRLNNISGWNTSIGGKKIEERWQVRFKDVANKCSLNMFATSLFKSSHALCSTNVFKVIISSHFWMDNLILDCWIRLCWKAWNLNFI